MRAKWALAGAGVILAAIAAAALIGFRKPAHPAAVPAMVAPAAPPASFTLTGKIGAAHIVVVNSDVSGNIDEFEVNVGDEVMEGQQLALIGSTVLEGERETAAAAVDKAQGRVDSAVKAVSAAQAEAQRAHRDAERVRVDFDRLEKTYQRQKELLAAGATPRLTYEKTERDYESGQQLWEAVNNAARAADERVRDTLKELDAANKILADRNEDLENAEYAEGSGSVQAPVDGVIVARNGEVGQPAGELAGGLFQIGTDLYDLEVAAATKPDVLARLRPGQPALVIVPDLQGTSMTGAVKEIKDGQVVISFKSSDPVIRPGMVAQIRLQPQ